MGTKQQNAPELDSKATNRIPRRGFSAFLDAQKDRVGTIQALVTIAAICVGGFWSYRLFIEQRQSYPRLKIEHRIQHWKISTDRNLLSVDEIVTNTGPVLLRLREGSIRVIQVVPIPPAVSKRMPDAKHPDQADAEPSIYDPNVWDVLVESQRKWPPEGVVIEPGESDVIPNEFVLPADVKVVAVYSYIANPAESKRHLGWNQLSYYDVEGAMSAPPNGRSDTKAK